MGSWDGLLAGMGREGGIGRDLYDAYNYKNDMVGQARWPGALAIILRLLVRVERGGEGS